MFPNFMIIGAAKSGTTSLYYALREHPEIYMSPVKEPRFFGWQEQRPHFAGPGDNLLEGRGLVTNIEQYEALFDGVKSEEMIGEASAYYLYNPLAPESIHNMIPDVKLIAILRNPADRAYSSYLHKRREGVEPCIDFREALADEERRIQEGWGYLWHYRQMGFYAKQVKRYLSLFPSEHFKVYIYEDYCRSPDDVIHDIFMFLGVDPSFKPSLSRRYNVTGIPRSRWLHDVMNSRGIFKKVLRGLGVNRVFQDIISLIRHYNLVRPRMDPEVRQELMEFYRNDMRELEILAGRDLSEWHQ